VSGWIVVRNWERFQHYRDRDPLWIKNYTALLANEDYLRLPAATRGLLHGLWIAYGASNGQLPNNTRSLSSRLRQRVTKRQLELLNHAGFIEVSASKPLALTRSREEETETEKETPKPPSEKGARERPKKSRIHPTGWREVRGSHGIDYIPDPFGTDRPPYSVPNVKGMDD
jgi:hypothetical protein